MECDRLTDALVRLTVRIVNSGASGSMLSTHTMLSVEDGAFVSLLDPPEEYREAALACRNVGTVAGARRARRREAADAFLADHSL